MLGASQVRWEKRHDKYNLLCRKPSPFQIVRNIVKLILKRYYFAKEYLRNKIYSHKNNNIT